MLAFAPIIPNTAVCREAGRDELRVVMLRLRTWLDHKKIRPDGFKLFTSGRIGFEFILSTERDALPFKGFE